MVICLLSQILGVPRGAGAEFGAISVVLGLGSLAGQEGPSWGWAGVVGLHSHSFPFFGHFLSAGFFHRHYSAQRLHG